ncbi:unnamed protein product [Caenorhabditis angaria]|uniref:CUB domain-containing protein n=1 Tax=Caenorhabditis angaria TaxID=860376 RepID=A0A9P1NBS4_9PELO|nr:unnamed protein product [Caenorhabditis angaria]
MFAFARSVVVTVLIVSNVASFSLYKNEKSKQLDCSTMIDSDGVFVYSPNKGNKAEMCDFTLMVPEKTTATIRLLNQTCQSILGTKSNMNAICNQPNQESHFFSDVYKFKFDSESSVSFEVEFNQITDRVCGEYVKNVNDWLGKTIRITIDRKQECDVRLPANVEVQFLDFVPNDKLKCCADFFLISTTFDDNIIDYSEKPSICDIRNNNVQLRSKCDRTYLKMRGLRTGDEMYLRVRGATRATFGECLGDVVPKMPENLCKRKSRATKWL